MMIGGGLLFVIVVVLIFLIATPQGKDFLHQIGFPGVQTEEGFQCPYAKHGDKDDKMGGGKCSNKVQGMEVGDFAPFK